MSTLPTAETKRVNTKYDRVLVFLVFIGLIVLHFKYQDTRRRVCHCHRIPLLKRAKAPAKAPSAKKPRLTPMKRLILHARKQRMARAIVDEIVARAAVVLFAQQFSDNAPRIAGAVDDSNTAAMDAKLFAIVRCRMQFQISLC